jgi:hypothetical protein
MIENNEKIMSLLDTLCKVSMCDPVEETDLNFIDSLAPGDVNTERFVVEFGVRKPKILVSVGQHIKLNDVIAYMNDIPVKSKICGRITEVTDRYIIGIYETDVDTILSMYNLSENMTEDDLLKQFDIKI